MLCGLTGRRLNRDNISLDHIVPLSKGGSNGPEVSKVSRTGKSY